MSNNQNQQKGIAVAIVAFFIVIVIALVGIGSTVLKNRSDKEASFLQSKYQRSVDELLESVDYRTATPIKASVQLGSTSLYDELPDIDKYQLQVKGTGNIDIEIFTSGEKAGTGNDSWLIDCANEFNRSNYQTASGKSVTISVRSVASGLAADYIISGRYLPDLYTPSNILFGEYAKANGGDLEIYKDRLVGNTAGILVRKTSSYNDVNSVIDDVIAGKLNMGYTNPQTSATGLNLLVELLKTKSSDNITDDKAIEAFHSFNNNIPFVAYTTQQMIQSASNGTLDAMVTEYQSYVNDSNLQSEYNFIPFGIRHDNPLYIVNKSGKSSDELEAIQIISDYLTGTTCQERATQCGFNKDNNYSNSYITSGAEITKSLKIYKDEKDAGKDIIAVFVADCSGSMDGDPINELKSSLTNGMQYINENNYVGLVSYSSDVTIEVPINKFDLTQKSYFQGAINNLQATGGTASYEAVTVALKMVQDAKVDHPDAKCMIFLLSDGYANGYFEISDIEYAIRTSEVPIYTIGYTSSADMAALNSLSGINEAASINADSDDIVYKIKSLFNAQL